VWGRISRLLDLPLQAIGRLVDAGLEQASVLLAGPVRRRDANSPDDLVAGLDSAARLRTAMIPVSGVRAGCSDILTRWGQTRPTGTRKVARKCRPCAGLSPIVVVRGAVRRAPRGTRPSPYAQGTCTGAVISPARAGYRGAICAIVHRPSRPTASYRSAVCAPAARPSAQAMARGDQGV